MTNEYDGNIIVVDNFLSEEESFIFKQWFDNFNYDNLVPSKIDFWHKRLLRQDETPLIPGYEKSFDEVSELIIDIRKRLVDTLNSIEEDSWCLSEFNFIKMFKDSNPFPERRNKDLEMFYHMDDQEANGYENRVFWGAVIYPNNEYTGGEIYYPKYKFKYKAKPGSLVLHRGNVKHGVLLVNDGIRYSIASTISKL